mgnify:CR=1 FL=1
MAKFSWTRKANLAGDNLSLQVVSEFATAHPDLAIAGPDGTIVQGGTAPVFLSYGAADVGPDGPTPKQWNACLEATEAAYRRCAFALRMMIYRAQGVGAVHHVALPADDLVQLDAAGAKASAWGREQSVARGNAQFQFRTYNPTQQQMLFGELHQTTLPFFRHKV